MKKITSFFKPTKKKLIVFLVLLGLSVWWLPPWLGINGGIEVRGIPFTWLVIEGCYLPDDSLCVSTEVVSWWGLIGDALIWYGVSSLVVKKIKVFT